MLQHLTSGSGYTLSLFFLLPFFLTHACLPWQATCASYVSCARLDISCRPRKFKCSACGRLYCILSGCCSRSGGCNPSSSPHNGSSPSVTPRTLCCCCTFCSAACCSDCRSGSSSCSSPRASRRI